MNQNTTDFIQLLKEYTSFKSISTDAAYKPEMEKLIKWLTGLFETHGFTVSLLHGPTTNPVVLAEYHVSDSAKTKLIYGHYDVQPAAKEDGWDNDPFDLYERDGRLIARGVVDNKGQNLMHIYSAITLIKAGKLKYNLKFMIEGNEETGNKDMEDIVRQNADKLRCDEIIISDGEVVGSTPTIEESLRGGGNITLTFTSSKNDLHSGMYGSGVPSSAKELIAFLAKMLLPDGTVTIPGFYDNVNPVTDEQRAKNEALLKINDPKVTGGVKATIGNQDFYTLVGLWPAIEVSGFQTGYTGEGYKNIIPASAKAKLNFRLVASQKPEQIVAAFKKYVADNVPSYIDVDLSIEKFSYPVSVNTSSPEMARIKNIQEQVFGQKPVVKNVGGGIPIVSDFKNILGIDTFLIPLGNDDCNMHGVDENFKIDLLEKGLELSLLMLS